MAPHFLKTTTGTYFNFRASGFTSKNRAFPFFDFFLNEAFHFWNAADLLLLLLLPKQPYRLPFFIPLSATYRNSLKLRLVAGGTQHLLWSYFCENSSNLGPNRTSFCIPPPNFLASPHSSWFCCHFNLHVFLMFKKLKKVVVSFNSNPIFCVLWLRPLINEKRPRGAATPRRPSTTPSPPLPWQLDPQLQLSCIIYRWWWFFLMPSKLIQFAYIFHSFFLFNAAIACLTLILPVTLNFSGRCFWFFSHNLFFFRNAQMYLLATDIICLITFLFIIPVSYGQSRLVATFHSKTPRSNVESATDTVCLQS